MSLKSFHVFFISICLLFAVGLGVWAHRTSAATGDRSMEYLALGSWFGGVVLAIYGVWFFRKIRGIKVS